MNDLSRAIELAPQHAPSYGNRSIVLRRLGRHREALDELEIIMQDPHDFVEREAAEALWIELSGR